jgi:hypothetical protein
MPAKWPRELGFSVERADDLKRALEGSDLCIMCTRSTRPLVLGIRAFDKANGELLWEASLPFGGNATPATYEVNGRQFVVIAAGGGRDGKPRGGVYVAFAIPQ